MTASEKSCGCGRVAIFLQARYSFTSSGPVAFALTAIDVISMKSRT
jgi:hypothetical protein